MFKIVKNINKVFKAQISHLNILQSSFLFKYTLNNRNFSKTYRDEKTNINPDDPYPKYDKKDFYDEQDLIINIGDKETFKGMLVICPTPIGNINDISIRQYEALKNGDILACEDTRKTGKLLELVQLKKMKEKFYSQFGVTFEDFINRGGLDMTDEQVKKEFFYKEKEEKQAGDKNKSENATDSNLNGESNSKENYNSFYETEEDVKKYKKFEEKLKNNFGYENKDESQKSTFKNETEDKNKKTKSFLNPNTKSTSKELLNEENFFDKLSKRVNNKIKKDTDPFGQLSNIVKEVNLNFSEQDPKNFINQLKKEMDEPITKDYYSQVKDSDDFLKRKVVIENSSEDLKDFIEPLAEDYDDKRKLSYKLRTKAKYIMGMSKKYDKKKNKDEDSEEEDDRSKEEILEEEMSLHMGLEDHHFGAYKKKIKDEKEKKGRGLLIPFNQENEEAKIPKLIRAMKMGLRIVLVSDAGTPTISDPGYKLVKEATKNGIIIEPLPGPSAVLTALSACALPTDKFLFVGYLPKNPSEKIARLEEIKRMAVTTCMFESPNRLKRSVETLMQVFGPRHEIYIGLELTKKFESHIHGTIETVNEILDKKEEIRGEITIIVSAFQKSKEEVDNEKNFNDEVKLEALDFAKKVYGVLNLSDKEMRSLLTEVCNISTLKAGKIVNTVKNRENSIATFYKKSNIKIEKVQINPIEDSLRAENEGEGKLKNLPKIIRRNRNTEKSQEKSESK